VPFPLDTPHIRVPFYQELLTWLAALLSLTPTWFSPFVRLSWIVRIILALRDLPKYLRNLLLSPLGCLCTCLFWLEAFQKTLQLFVFYSYIYTIYICTFRGAYSSMSCSSCHVMPWDCGTLLWLGPPKKRSQHLPVCRLGSADLPSEVRYTWKEDCSAGKGY